MIKKPCDNCKFRHYCEREKQSCTAYGRYMNGYSWKRYLRIPSRALAEAQGLA